MKRGARQQEPASFRTRSQTRSDRWRLRTTTPTGCRPAADRDAPQLLTCNRTSSSTFYTASLTTWPNMMKKSSDRPGMKKMRSKTVEIQMIKQQRGDGVILWEPAMVQLKLQRAIHSSLVPVSRPQPASGFESGTRLQTSQVRASRQTGVWSFTNALWVRHNVVIRTDLQAVTGEAAENRASHSPQALKL